MMSTTRTIVIVLGIGTGCGAGPPAMPASPEAGTDSVELPAVIPDPVAVLPPELAVRPPGGRWQSNALLDLARGIPDSPAGHQRAISLLQRAARADSTNAGVLWELGRRSDAARRPEQAREVWRRLENLDPAYPGLARRLTIARLREARERWRTAGAGAWPARDETPVPGPPIRIAAVGDVTMGRAWPEPDATLPPDDARFLFERVAGLLQNADITFGNLETVLADSGESTKCRPGSTACFAFRAPTRYAHTLRDAGFDVLSINNNHAGDFGELGRRATAEALDAAGLQFSGPSTGLATWHVDGLWVAMLAFSTGDGPHRIQEIDRAQRAVATAAATHDLVLVSFHGGAEGSDKTRVPKMVEHAYGENRGDVFAFARAVVDAGADLVLGHGPHVLRGMEIYRGRFIAYSLGNFSGWNNFNLTGPLGWSAVLALGLSVNGVVMEASLHPVVIDRPGLPRPDPDRRALDLVRRMSLEDLGNEVFDEAGRYRR